jgi:catechol 2,3-dioxygenase-like lactoylglutathione lyase family enzyme
MLLHGSINHIALTVSNLETAMDFFRPMLEALGYTTSEIMPYKNSLLTVNVNNANGTGVNIWQSKYDHDFEVYEPGLHHIAFNVDSCHKVDDIHDMVKSMGAEILDGPAEFPFAHHGYYAVYFLGPDNIKFEIVHMTALATAIASGNPGSA